MLWLSMISAIIFGILTYIIIRLLHHLPLSPEYDSEYDKMTIYFDKPKNTIEMRKLEYDYLIGKQ